MIFFALIGGTLPPLIWLWFWLREDCHPEPKRIIFVTFTAGVFAIPIILYVEKLIAESLDIASIEALSSTSGIIALAALAFVEEVGKYTAAYVVAFRNKNYDEPVDAMVYLISAALGFAALENALFLVQQISGDVEITLIVVANNLRFMGATLLHVAASGIAGAIIGLAFFKSKKAIIIATVVGLATATALHTLFNFFILNSNGVPFNVFIGLWITIVILILLFEKVKSLKHTSI